MERLDKLLAGTGKWSRREVKALQIYALFKECLSHCTLFNG